MADATNIPGIRLCPGVIVPDAALAFTFVSSSGPGGQNVNKRATKASLRVRLVDLPMPPAPLDRLRAAAGPYLVGDGELLITADEFRSQERNRSACIERLSTLVRQAMVRPKTRRATKPTRGSKERRLSEKKRRGDIKKTRRDGE